MTFSRSDDNPRQDLRRLTIVISFAIAFFGAALIAIIVFAGWAANYSAVERDNTLVANALNQNVARVLSEQKSIAYWDEAVVNIAINWNYDWIREEFGIYLTESYGQDEIFILNDKNEPVFTMKDGGDFPPDVLQRHLKEIAPLITEIRTGATAGLAERPDLFGPSQENFEVFSGVLACARYRGHILAVEGRPAVVTGITICPTVDTELNKGSDPHLLISIVYIDEAFVDDMGRSLLLPDLALTEAVSSRRGLAAEPFITDDGERAGVLSWTPRQPGNVLLTVILPLVVLGVIAIGLLTSVMLRRLRATSSELADREAQARHLAKHDALSGLPNRHNFAERTDAALSRRRSDGVVQPAVIAYVDVDRFKDINDTLGHHAGDELVKAIANRLSTEIPASDFLARFGGDEFAVLRAPAGPGSDQALAATVAQAFDAPFSILGQNIRVTASIGLARAPEHGVTTDELMRHADIALYEAKRRGRDQARFFSAEMAEQVQYRRKIEVDLRTALDTNGLALHYQPIVSCTTGAITGVEALLRWRHPVEGDISPAVFIPIAEDSGLMPALGAWVLKRAISDAARWPGIEVAINLSPAQFHHVDLEDLLAGILKAGSVEASRIVLEITEGLLLESSTHTKNTLQALRRMGFKIALDDFGTGYSSLSYLAEFKFDKLKIDRSFVSGISQAKSARTIVHSVVNLGRGLGMDVVAEGVETEPEAAIMRFFGCTDMQGYYFSRPLPVENVGPVLEKFSAAAAAISLESGAAALKSSAA
jgi:diguanylate cyclase (GGDEF)-like protein